jgi:hypothetical protein
MVRGAFETMHVRTSPAFNAVMRRRGLDNPGGTAPPPNKGGSAAASSRVPGAQPCAAGASSIEWIPASYPADSTTNRRGSADAAASPSDAPAFNGPMGGRWLDERQVASRTPYGASRSQALHVSAATPDTILRDPRFGAAIFGEGLPGGDPRGLGERALPRDSLETFGAIGAIERSSGRALGGVTISAEVRWRVPARLDLDQTRLPFALQVPQ